MRNPTLEFIAESFSNLREIGTVFPCSSSTGRKMVKHIEPYTSGTIVELGSGTGHVTEQIAFRTNGRHKVYCIEKNKNFCKILRERFNGNRKIEIVNDSAENIIEHAGRDIQCVISVLPLANFELGKKKELLETIRYSLAPRGRFVQFQYIPCDKALVNKYFDIDLVEYSWANLPPGVIYTGMKRESKKL